MLVNIMGTPQNNKKPTASPGHRKALKSTPPKAKPARFLEGTKGAFFDWQINFIKSFADGLCQPAIIVDSFPKILHLNSAFLTSYGKSNKNTRDCPLSNYLDQQSLDLIKNYLSQPNKPKSCQHNIILKNKPTKAHVQNITTFNKNGIYLITLTEIKNKDNLDPQDNLLGLVSHELKTPLTAIKAFGQLTDKILDNQNPKAKTYLEKMDSQINRVIGLIDDIFDVSKIHLGKFAVTKKTQSLDKLLAETLEEIKLSKLGNHQIVVEGYIGKKIRVDTNRIKQVLLNIISNAIKYSPKADKINIKLSHDHKTAKIKVQDYGQGITAGDLDNIFGQFYQAKQNTGLGLGLYISQKIIKAHNGEINVTSRKGQGSTFTINLPF